MATADKPRKVVQTGGVGGGRCECDGADHWWVVDDHAALNCKPETHVGPCRDPKACAALADALAKQKGG